MHRVPRDTRAVGCALIRDVLHLAGQARLRVTGSSMLPGILPGDVLLVRSRKMTDLFPGDIALFTRHNRLFAHRVVAAEPHGDPFLVTRGDALAENDAPVLAHELLGQVAAIVRGRSRVEVRATLWRRWVSMLLRHSEVLTRGLVFMLNARRVLPERAAWHS
jgi:signal peptidase I